MVSSTTFPTEYFRDLRSLVLFPHNFFLQLLPETFLLAGLCIMPLLVDVTTTSSSSMVVLVRGTWLTQSGFRDDVRVPALASDIGRLDMRRLDITGTSTLDTLLVRVVVLWYDGNGIESEANYVRLRNRDRRLGRLQGPREQFLRQCTWMYGRQISSSPTGG